MGCAENQAKLMQEKLCRAFLFSAIYAQKWERVPPVQTGNVALWSITLERPSLTVGISLLSRVRQQYRS